MPRLTRRHLPALFALPFAAPARAQAFPTQPVRLIIPFPPGGPVDTFGRILAPGLSEQLRQPVVLDNRAGAGGVIGADAVAKSPPDGYTFLLGTIATHAINPALLPKMPYNAAKDFAPVILLGSISNVLVVNAETPYKSVKDVIVAAKAKPDTIPTGTAGQGTSQHMSAEAFKLQAGADLNVIFYKGSAPAMQDLIGGQIPTAFDTVTVAGPHIKSGKIRALAVTSAKRTKTLPDVPTMQEAGVAGYDVASWQALFAPAGTPAAIVNRMNAEIEKIIALPDVAAKMESLGLEHTPNTAVQFADFTRSEQAKWAKIVKDGNIKVE
jgi:tripartite-type tricarboxylate transporter receptor subunit TctC